jgi:hypothetical protein
MYTGVKCGVNVWQPHLAHRRIRPIQMQGHFKAQEGPGQKERSLGTPSFQFFKKEKALQFDTSTNQTYINENEKGSKTLETHDLEIILI